MGSPTAGSVSLTPRCRSPELQVLDVEKVVSSVTSGSRFARQWSRSRETFQFTGLGHLPWLGWAFVYTTVLLFFFGHRCVALKALVTMYSSPKSYTFGFKIAALGLGFLEDFVCTTYFACALWVFDIFKFVVRERLGLESGKFKFLSSRRIGELASFTVSWLLFVATMAPFVADLLLVQIRQMRFTFDLITMAVNENKYVSAAPISNEEVTEGYMNAASLAVFATFFAIVRTWTRWGDLTRWNPTHIVSSPKCLPAQNSKVTAVQGVKYVELALEEGSTFENSTSEDDNTDDTSSTPTNTNNWKIIYRSAVQAAIVFAGLVVVPAIVVSIASGCSPLVAYSGLNATLNELLGHAFQPTAKSPTSSDGHANTAWIKTLIHATEDHKLFGDGSLYRRTTGFRGDLAFNINVTHDNPPNVLVIGVESFRFHDSRYLVGDADPSNLFKGTDMTITPNFDRWAKRGVALRNIWSSNPTSRSLESGQFAQIPYDSPVKTGITGGRRNTKMAGLPQLFSAKGYETFFTTGCPTDFENWNVFLPSHGFETVCDSNDMMKLAESDLGIGHDEWYGDKRRGFTWGVHDDINLQLLGDLLVNKTNEQRERVTQGHSKKPLFITHYTISSHAPFKARPAWYSEAEKPDFSALYEGEKHADDVKNYLEMRHFTDMQLGKFLDRMEKEGILNDTIVVIMGDHGQAPEADSIHTDEVSVTRVASAIIAEGRLGGAAGLVIEDAAEQYDILNTLADITGVPEGGFIQNGIGRSLKRKVPFAERVVFSNVPGYKMSVVRGHQRLRYDRVTDWTQLHDIETDHDMTTDLFPELPPEKQAEWLKWRDSGRQLAAYYKQRWDENCLLSVEC